MISKLLGNRTNYLVSKSAGIMNVFTSTLKQLDEVNKEILAEKESKADKIAAMQEEYRSLDTQLFQNNKTISKISEFIN